MAKAELVTLREVLHDAAVLAGRLSSEVSAGRIPAECAGAVAATRDCVLAAVHCAAFTSDAIERVEKSRLAFELLERSRVQ